MESTQLARTAVLRPLLAVLTSWNVGADGITLASLLAGLLFVPLFPLSPGWALTALLAHALLDGIDGCLARYQGAASRKGSFTDTLADQCVLAGVILSLANLQLLSGTAAGLFLFAYTLVVTFAMIRNALDVPYHWLVRPRFLIYAAVPVTLWGTPTLLEPLTWGLTGLLALKAWTGFLALRRVL